MAFDAIFLFEIALILFLAKVFGEVAERLKMSPIVGEIAAGLLIGPILLIVTPNDFLLQMANLGILFIAFLIGINVKFDEARKDAVEGAVMTLVISAVSFISGTAVGVYFFQSLETGLFIGAAMMVSSTSIGIKSLIDAGDIKSRVHDAIITMSRVGDLLSVVAIAAVFSYITPRLTALNEMAALLAVIIGVAAVLAVFGAKHIGRAFSAVGRLKDEHIALSIPLSIIFVIAFLSESAGIAGIAGAFLVGMALSRSPMTETSIIPKMKILAYGFFAPMFFAYSAVLLDVSTFASVMPALAASVILVTAATLAGSSIIGRRYGFRGGDALKIGAAKLPRGEFSVIIAQIGLAGLITGAVYSLIILTVLATAVITPVAMRILYRR